jgi:hypothetical protein
MSKSNTTGFFIIILLITFNSAGCKNSDNRSIRSGKSKLAENEIVPVKKEEAAALERVTFFIENSGSMFGYVNRLMSLRIRLSAWPLPNLQNDELYSSTEHPTHNSE